MPGRRTRWGPLYEYGFGLAKDPKQAKLWYEKAAEQGDAKGQSNLGRLYIGGGQGEQSWSKAYAWLSLSKAQGEITADKLMESYQPHFTSDVITEGNRLAQEYRQQIQKQKKFPNAEQKAAH